MAAAPQDALPVFTPISHPSPPSPLRSLRRRRFTIPLLTFLAACFLFFWHDLWIPQHNWPPLVHLDDDPRPLVASTSLGIEAEQAYHLGSLSPHDYRQSLESFIETTFPPRLRPQLKNSLDTFLDFESTHPRPEPPKLIWQTNAFLTKDARTRSWSILNQEYEYHFLSDNDANRWIRRNFKGSGIEWAWNVLPEPVMKADLLRYLLLLIEGGTYSDIDTTCLKPIPGWGSDPTVQGRVTEGLPSTVVGIEADVGERSDWHQWWSRPIQIVQWTMSFSPGHPALLDTVRRIYAKSLEQQRLMYTHPVDKHSLINTTLEWTGPAVFTDAMLRYSWLESDLRWPDLRGLKKPLRTGSVTYLPVTGFSPGVGNFGAGELDDEQAMVMHAFSGSWKPKKGKGH